jgi:glutaredoxin
MAFTFLLQWLGRLPAQRPDMRVLMYTRAGCCLCDEAWEVLKRLQARHGFALETMNVDESAKLIEAYGACVPVVTINGKVRFRGGVNEVLLRRMLEAVD